jgi:hypothetical protein
MEPIISSSALDKWPMDPIISSISRNAFHFNQKYFSFSQDMTISVRSGGIKPEYALLKFYRDNISVLCFLFLGLYFFLPVYALFLVICVISTNQKRCRKGFPIYL